MASLIHNRSNAVLFSGLFTPYLRRPHTKKFVHFGIKETKRLCGKWGGKGVEFDLNVAVLSGTYPFVVAELEPTGHNGLIGMRLHRCVVVAVVVVVDVIDAIVDTIAAHTSGGRCENSRLAESTTFGGTQQIGNVMIDIVAMADGNGPMTGRTAFRIVTCSDW